MKKTLISCTLLSGFVAAHAAIIQFDISPPGSDTAVGLSPLNEAHPVTESTGSGNEIGAGITFDTDTLTLSLSLGYGSAFGFTDLTGPAIAAHIHGPAPVGVAADVLVDLAPIHVLAGNPDTGGSIVGDVVLTAEQAAHLLAGLTYINVHTARKPLGEIRGQLIPVVNTAPSVICPASTNVPCPAVGGAAVQLLAQVSDPDGDALTVVWSANGVPLQTNAVPAGNSLSNSVVAFAALYQLGTNVVTISVSDGHHTPVICHVTVTVADGAPVTISGISVSPNVLWPPNHKFVPVQVSVSASGCGTPNCRITAIRSNQDVLARGSGNTAPDWNITGDLTALIRAERAGPDRAGRTYTLTVQCTDAAGNVDTREVTVFVPHDRRHAVSPQGPGPGPGNGNLVPGNSNRGKKTRTR